MASQTDDARDSISGEAGRADTRQQADPYRLQLNTEAREHLAEVLDELTLHFAIGFLTGAATVPEPLSFLDCVELLREHSGSDEDDEDIDVDDSLDDDFDDSDDSDETLSLSPEVLRSLRTLFESVSERIADGAVASLIPIADDAAACDEWIEGLDLVVTQTQHKLTDEEGAISLRVFGDRLDDAPALAESKESARATLAADVTRLIQLWSEVPPYDPEQDELPWLDDVPKE